jgi:hypothetical protein
MIALLQHISNQLADPSLSGSNSIVPAEEPPTSRDVRVTVFWMLSIIFSLSAALFGILAKQWIREYQKDVGDAPKKALIRRQLRYESFMYWKVPEIISSLPILVELAVILFFIGILDFLRGANIALFALVSGSIGLVLLFVSLTTALPTIFHLVIPNPIILKQVKTLPCAYRSPQAHAFRLLATPLSLMITWFRPSWTCRWLTTWLSVERYFSEAPYIFYFNFEGKAITWIRDNLVNSPRMANNLCHMLVQANDTTYAGEPGRENCVCKEHLRFVPAAFWDLSQFDMLPRETQAEAVLWALNFWECDSCSKPNIPEQYFGYPIIENNLDDMAFPNGEQRCVSFLQKRTDFP